MEPERPVEQRPTLDDTGSLVKAGSMWATSSSDCRRRSGEGSGEGGGRLTSARLWTTRRAQDEICLKLNLNMLLAIVQNQKQDILCPRTHVSRLCSSLVPIHLPPHLTVTDTQYIPNLRQQLSHSPWPGRRAAEGGAAAGQSNQW